MFASRSQLPHALTALDGLRQDPTLPNLELACSDPAGNAALGALAERIKRKRHKLSRGSDALDVLVSPYRSRQAEQVRAGWFGFFQGEPFSPLPLLCRSVVLVTGFGHALHRRSLHHGPDLSRAYTADSTASSPTESNGISVRLSRPPPVAALGSSKQQYRQPASGPSQSGRKQSSPAVPPPQRKVSLTPPAPPRPGKSQMVGSSRSQGRTAPFAAQDAPAPDPTHPSNPGGWLSIFGQRAQG